MQIKCTQYTIEIQHMPLSFSLSLSLILTIPFKLVSKPPLGLIHTTKSQLSSQRRKSIMNISDKNILAKIPHFDCLHYDH